jgi:hypothetical protein
MRREHIVSLDTLDICYQFHSLWHIGTVVWKKNQDVFTFRKLSHPALWIIPQNSPIRDKLLITDEASVLIFFVGMKPGLQGVTEGVWGESALWTFGRKRDSGNGNLKRKFM